MGKAIWRGGSGLLLTLSMFLGLTWSLLGTQTGVEWLVRNSQEWLPGHLEVEGLQGHLLGHLTIARLQYRDEHHAIELKNLRLTWNPSALWSRVVWIRQISIDTLHIQQHSPSAQNASQKPVKLPDIHLPLKIRLDALDIRNMRYGYALNASPLLLEQLHLQADWQDDELHLQRFTLTAPQGRLAVSGRLRASDAYPLALELDWQTQLTKGPVLGGQGRIHGDMEHLQIVQRVEKGAHLQLRLDIEHILQAPSWQLQAQIDAFPHWPASGVLKGLRARVQAEGDLQYVRIHTQLEGPKEAQDMLSLNLDAHYHFRTERFELNGHWQNLRWPLQGEARLLAARGHAKLSGELERYQLEFDSVLEGEGIPKAQWRIQGQGNRQAIRFSRIHADILQGQLAMTGQLAWTPDVAWDFQLQADALNPQALAVEWPGRLDLRAHLRGQLQSQGPRLWIDLHTLNGQLRNQPVMAKGRVAIDERQHYTFERLQIQSGSARIEMNGRLSQTWDLNWQIDIPELDALLPQSAGRIQGQGRLQGSRIHPHAQGRLTFMQVQYAQNRLDQAHLHFDLNLDEVAASTLEVQAQGVHVAEHSLPFLSLKAQGPLRQQRLKLQLQHEQVQVQMQAEGAFELEHKQWQGRIAQLQVDAGRDFGRWRLENPVSIVLSPERQRFESLCLRSGLGKLCAALQRQKGKGQAKLNVHDFPLQQLQPWLPPEIQHLTGQLELETVVLLEDVLQARMQAVLSPGELVYRAPEGQSIHLPHRNGRLHVNLDKTGLQADWMLALGEHRLEGMLELPRAPLERTPLQAPVRGRLRMQIANLDLLPVFIPDIQEIDGNIQVDLRLSGQVTALQIAGRAGVHIQRVLIPRLGLEPRDMQLQILGDGQNGLRIEGRLISGEGTLQLNGRLRLDAQQGWPLNLTLVGRGVQLANLPEAQVIIDPDLKLQTGKDWLTLRGQIDVPVALITLDDLPAGSESISPDVVVLDEHGRMESTSNMRMDVDVAIELGERVHFKGLGLSVDLGGRLSIRQGVGKMPVASGELKILQGSFRAYGQNLKIEEGRIFYAGGRIDNPGLQLRATRKIDDVEVGVDLTGTAKKPNVAVFSNDPEISDKDAVALLLTGQKSDNLAQATIYAGRQVTPKLSVGVNLGAGDAGTEFVARYKLLEHVDVEATSSSKKSGVSIGYSFDIE